MKLAGSIETKIQVANFESVGVSAFIEIDKDVSFEELNQEINDKLIKQLNSKMVAAINNYKENRNHWNKLIKE